MREACAATSVVCGAPILFLFVVSRQVAVAPGSLWLVTGSLLSVVVAVVLGSLVWSRTGRAGGTSFAGLMLWTWARRRRAEHVLETNVDRLGLDRSGRRLRRVEISSEDQLLMLRQLSDSLEIKDAYTRHHSARVEDHSFRTAVELGLDDEEVEVLRRAASVHDVGKIHVSDEVLSKPGELAPEERAEIEKHALTGARMVRGLGDERITAAVRHHHERWDGRGYPDGLAGDEIPLFARIIAVADTYDAITSTRSYRPRASSAKAQEIIRAESGAQFDPVVAEAFLSMIADRASRVGGFLVMLLPEVLIGRSISTARRMGTASLSPALASAFAVAFISPGALVIPPAPGPATRPPTPVVVQHGELHDATGAWRASAVAKEPNSPRSRVLGKKVGAGRAEQRGRQPRKKDKRNRPAAPTQQAAAPAPAGTTPSGGSSGSGGSGSSGGGAEPAAEPVAPARPTTPAPPVPIDPVPEEGRDCEEPRDSTGRELHCDG